MRHIKILFLFIVFCSALSAQVDSVYNGEPPLKNHEKPKKKKDTEKWDAIKKKLTYGGNFQAWFGNPTFLFLSPTIGYMPTPKLNVGVGFIYNYTHADYYGYGSYSQSVVGVHSYVRYIITDGIFAQLQYDKLHQNDFLSFPETRKVWVDYLFAGGGFRQRIGNKAALTTALMYNLTPSPLSIYYPNRLIIQFGIVAGF
jgi:hypothetical protein